MSKELPPDESHDPTQEDLIAKIEKKNEKAKIKAAKKLIKKKTK